MWCKKCRSCNIEAVTDSNYVEFNLFPSSKPGRKYAVKWFTYLLKLRSMQPSLCALSTAPLVLPGLLSGCKIGVSKALLVPKLANYQVYSYRCRLVNQFTPLSPQWHKPKAAIPSKLSLDTSQRGLWSAQGQSWAHVLLPLSVLVKRTPNAHKAEGRHRAQIWVTSVVWANGILLQVFVFTSF